jgi:tetratricopeptide (TPR) repeat protein
MGKGGTIPLMGWLSDFNKGRQIDSARAEMNRARSPFSVAQFVERCIDLKALEPALEEAENGFKEFPTSEKLLDAYKHLIRVKCEEDLKKYRHEVKTQPSPKAYYRLACLYKEMRDYDQSIELARKGVDLYPEFEGNYIVLGDIRYERFQRDLRASDGLVAIELFEKASDLNHENYRLLYQLAEIYQAIGARDLAIEKLNAILSFAPDDANGLKLLDTVQRMKPSKQKVLKEILQDFERRASNHAGQRNMGAMGQLGQRYTRNPDHLARKLRSLERIEGFTRAIVLGPAGEVLASYPGGPDENKKQAEAVKDMLDAAIECCLRMDISTFEKGFLESPGGYTYVLIVDRLRFGILCGSNAKKDKIVDEVFRFIEHDLYI